MVTEKGIVMELSNRLQAVANLVTPGSVLADVGTDHGYIPIYLTEQGICPRVIAMDINPGPLDRAREHLQQQQKMLPVELMLSDGLNALQPGIADSIIIAGMGGGLVIKILQENRTIVEKLQECILQPQSELYKVRAFLLQEGFSIVQEDIILEDGKYYPMMKAVPDVKNPEKHQEWSQIELLYGRYLLREKNPVLKQYLERELLLKNDILKGLKNRSGEAVHKRRCELEEDLDWVKHALVCYEVVSK